ncbi:uncharacterized protein [Solanum tuberosum]|uniref:uncharacterized protein n=1 Tax=Solanum tuberosum TaxID=4113 RepID=UPI00073A1E29|nr:PREDICTED: uncharacterized protein LOC107062566 [Solanum tuberosum]
MEVEGSKVAEKEITPTPAIVRAHDHKGETIAKGIEACLLDWGIENLFTVTLDNATANSAAITHLKARINDWKVVSESAFSTGGRILDCYRSSLSPKTAEALICSQQWLRTATFKEYKFEDLLDEIQNLEILEKENPGTPLRID